MHRRSKPLVPERDSSLYDCFTNGPNASLYGRFRPLIPATSVPNLSSIPSLRCNSNTSSNEADEESSLSSMNSNQMIVQQAAGTEENGIGIYMTPALSLSTTNMSTFKTAPAPNPLPSKPSEVKRRSNNRKQIYATVNLSNKPIENEPCGPPPPPPPPFPTDFTAICKPQAPPPPPAALPKPTKVEPVTANNDFQAQIEQAKNRLKRVDVEPPAKPTLKPNGLTKPTCKIPSSEYGRERERP